MAAGHGRLTTAFASSAAPASRPARKGLSSHPTTLSWRFVRGERESLRRQLSGPMSEVEALQKIISSRLKRSLHIRHLDSGSCNACDWELSALLNPFYDIQRLGIDFVASPRHADLLLVTGTMTRNLTEAARLTYEAMPEPRLVVAV